MAVAKPQHQLISSLRSPLFVIMDPANLKAELGSLFLEDIESSLKVSDYFLKMVVSSAHSRSIQ